MKFKMYAVVLEPNGFKVKLLLVTGEYTHLAYFHSKQQPDAYCSIVNYMR